ncbi:hypothetical protein J6590_059679 [Homalodisca vitripennis]|nr:hypothetical protein J6590_059679 [Homalodisca vitripennis]
MVAKTKPGCQLNSVPYIRQDQVQSSLAPEHSASDRGEALLQDMDKEELYWRNPL